VKRSASRKGLVRFSEETYLEEPKGPPLLREQWVRDADGSVLKYLLAYIDFSIYSGDNGRVLGYDNAHRLRERHLMGEVESVPFRSYRELFDTFIQEVHRIRRKHGKR
jgi:hypothetical protein